MTYYTPQDIADMFGVKVETVWKWLRTKQLPALNINNRTYRISQDDLNKFIAKQK